MKKTPVYLVSFAVSLLSCVNNDANSDNLSNSTSNIPFPQLLSYSVVNAYPHDTFSFTQGLTFYNGQLYESTGAPLDNENNGTWLGPVNLTTGKAEKKVDLGKAWFGEGITFLNDKIYQLTWQTSKGFIYDAKTFKKIGEFFYQGEGWGLTNDGSSLIMSNGSSNLLYLHPDSLHVSKTLSVQDNNGPVPNLNELEYINGFIYANQWQTAYILKIDPATGNVVARMDLSKLVNEVKNKDANADLLNGIAFDSTNNKLFVTGKKWPTLYEIKLL